VLTAHRVEDIRAAEAAEMAKLPDGELMQRAVRGLVAELSDIPAGDLVVVLTGPGDNGGDALYAAAHLLERGVRVDVALVDPTRAHEGGLAAARAAGARLVSGPTRQRWCLDGMFGIGSRPGLSGPAAEWAKWARESGARTIAVDVPSGIDVDRGTLPGTHVEAERTVTFGTHKIGLLAGPAAEVAGDIRFVDIGLEFGEPALEALESSDGELLAPALPCTGGHKYTRGVVGVAAGSDEYAGAAHLVVAGAQAGTAGMVRFVGSPTLGTRVVDRAPEVVLGRGRVQAWVVGPGGGEEAREQLALALAAGAPAVIDADALSAIPSRLQIPALLTPHAGELAQLLDTERDAIEADPVAAATQAADRWNCTVLLKGPRTLVATPGRPMRVNLTGTPWLGTAGSGDVLAGFSGSLLASGLDPHDAASAAAYLHGRAAEVLSGPVTASDIADTLPIVLGEWVEQ
jgi:hydroxyethylthiazole kinase-like uncharacterized protein yjeF